VLKTYETDTQGRAALAHLHYLIGGCDWWIVEQDADPEHVGQVQAFGIADLGMGAELGHISTPELMENGAEPDLYFKSDDRLSKLSRLTTAEITAEKTVNAHNMRPRKKNQIQSVIAEATRQVPIDHYMCLLLDMCNAFCRQNQIYLFRSEAIFALVEKIVL
jgi:hypothetical protein